MKSSIKNITRHRLKKNLETGLPIIIGLVALIVVFLRWFRAFFKSNRGTAKYIDSRGYVVLSQLNELEHRFIAKWKLGRDLEQNEIVHHINGQKTDNRIWNLCLMDKEKHEHFHSWLRWKKEKSGRYPSIKDQKRVLAEEYGGILLENFKSSMNPDD